MAEHSTPTVVRTGAVVRVEPVDRHRAGRALALSMVDLRFDDGRVERWLGPGQLADRTFSTADGAALVALGEETFLINVDALAEELADAYGDHAAQALIDAPREVVVEWNRELPAELQSVRPAL